MKNRRVFQLLSITALFVASTTALNAEDIGDPLALKDLIIGIPFGGGEKIATLTSNIAGLELGRLNRTNLQDGYNETETAEFEILSGFILGAGTKSVDDLSVEFSETSQSNASKYKLSLSSGSENNSVFLSITAILEPSLFGLLAGLGALALAGTRRRRKA